MPTKSFRAVEIVKVGDWSASAGDGKVTREDLAAMVESYADPLIDRAPVKLGHNDLRFQDVNGRPPLTGDGDPAYGWITDPRISEDGTTLLADIVGVPEKLADMIPHGYRRRSVEMIRNRVVGGKVHPVSLRALSLLGTTPPAVKGLADITEAYGTGPLHYADPGATLVVLTLSESDDTAAVPQPTDYTANSGGAGSTTHTTDKGAPKMGNTKVDAKILAAFGLDDTATDEQVAEAAKAAGITFAPAEPATTPAKTGLTPEEIAATVKANEDAQQAALDAALKNTPSNGGQITALSESQVAALGPLLNSGILKLIDAETLTALSAGAEAGAQAQATLVKDRRKGILDAAVVAGKVAPTTYAAFAAMLDKDEDGAVAVINLLPAVFPTASIGHATETALSEVDAATQAQMFIDAGYIIPDGN